MIQQILQFLEETTNEAADDVLLSALRNASDDEKQAVLDALFYRKTLRGLTGIVGEFDRLDEPLKEQVLENVKLLHHALRECGRSTDADRRRGALLIISKSRQGKLAYILSENLHDSNDDFSRAAAESLLALAKWVSSATRRLQQGIGFSRNGMKVSRPPVTDIKPISDNSIAASRLDAIEHLADESVRARSETLNSPLQKPVLPIHSFFSNNVIELKIDGMPISGSDIAAAAEGDVAVSMLSVNAESQVITQSLNSTVNRSTYEESLEPPELDATDTTYRDLQEQRGEIEQAIARAMEISRGKYGAEILRAALLLCDWPGSRTLAILSTAKHGGQSAMVRRLQQPPTEEHVEAFLLGASHGQLRSHFGVIFSHIDQAPVLDSLLQKTHWVKDHQLQLCIHQVTRGKWWSDEDLSHDISRRDPVDAAMVGEWIAVSGVHDVLQDERLERIRQYVGDNFEAKLRLLRLVMKRPRRGSSAVLLKAFLSDSDERIVRMAARDIVRRKPQDYENMLLQLMTSAPDSVRRVVARSVGHAGFDHFWQKFDRLNRATRKQAGRAMMKVLPDAVPRLARRLLNGPLPERLKAMQIVQELELSEQLRTTLTQLCADVNAKIRSKAVFLLGEDDSVVETLLDRVLQDTDPRVRANAIEVLEQKQRAEYLPLLAQRARANNSRERANAIKAMHKMKVKTATVSLDQMLHDERPDHRISAMWTLKQIGWWKLLADVGKLAKTDVNLNVRRYALGVLKSLADELNQKKSQPPQTPKNDQAA